MVQSGEPPPWRGPDLCELGAATGVIFSFGLLFVFGFLLSRGKTLLFVQELNLDHPSGVGGMPEAGRSPSEREADGSSRAHV